MKRIAVLTSGGDAPGMNACLRAVVRSALAREIEVIGVWRGYEGLLAGDFMAMDSRTVGNIIQRGGTILQTSRSAVFLGAANRAKAAKNLRGTGADALVAIGGDGTFRGLHAFHEEQGITVMGVPGTIDNDVAGTDYAIGFDTAINTALDAIDKIRDTATSLERLFFVEVMGRQAGFIALDVALAGGASDVLVPEEPADLDRMCENIRAGMKAGKRSFIVVVAEGEEAGGAMEVARRASRMLEEDYRVVVLGHIQRGGTPTARDRILASRLGVGAVEGLLERRDDCMVGEVQGKLCFTPLMKTWTEPRPLPQEDLRLMALLSW